MERVLRGIGGSPVTPFTRAGRLDFETLGRQVEFLIRQGVHFLAYPMHMGESPNLTAQERLTLATFMVDAVKQRVPLFLNASATGTDPALEYARQAEEAGASGVVLLSPYCWKPAREANFDHFLTVGRAIGVGLIAYNNPGVSQVEIGLDTMAQLMEKLPNFIGLKEGGGRMEYFTGVCRLASGLRPDFSVLTAGDFLLTSMPVGGAGAFSACMTVAPHLTLRLYEACRRRDLERARLLQYRVEALIQLLTPNYPAMVKYAMTLMGRPVGATRKPIRPLTKREKDRIKEGLYSLGVLEEEPQGW